MLIGEVAERSGVSARMLRHYDRIGLVVPSGRTHGGYREYSADDVRRLFHVEALRSLGLSLPEVRDVLEDLSFDPTAVVDELVARTRERLAQDTELLRRLVQVRAVAPADWSDALRTVALVRGATGAPSSRLRLALASGAGADVPALVARLLDEPDANAAGGLAWALARQGDGAVPALAAALHDGDPSRRRRAVDALEKLSSAGADSALAQAVSHDDLWLAGRAVLALGRLGSRDAVPALVGLVADGRDDVDAAGVLGALAERHGAAAEVVAAVDAALRGGDPAARRRLAAALADVPGGPADALLGDLLDDPDPGVAATATYLLRGRPTRP